MEQLEIIIVSLFGGAWVLLLAVVLTLCCQVASLRKRVSDLEAAPRMRVQRLTMDNSHHAFHNPALSPDEELSKRGYSMYVADDVEASRPTERQTGGEFVEELSRELESRQQRQMAPPFLLQGIQENKLKSRDLKPAGNHDNAPGNHTNQVGNHGNQISNQSSLYGNNINPVANQGKIDNQSNYNHQRTRQSDTNPNFIY